VLPWRVGELDLVLAQAAATGVPAGIGEPTLATLVNVLAVGRRFKLPVEQNCALWGPIPRALLPGAHASLFDRLFNLPTFVRLDGTLPKDAISFVHPSLRTAGVPSPADNTLHRMLAGLGVADEQLAKLIGALAGPLGANPTATNEQDRGFLLTADNLTLLYRHARLAQLLRLPVPDLFQLIGLAGFAGQVASLADLTTLLSFYDWWRTSGYTLDDLTLVTGGTVRQPARYPNPAAVAADIIARLAADHALEFADTVFAFVPGVTEEQSRALIAANASVLERLPDGRTMRLTPGFDPTAALTVPAGITTAELDLRAALLAHHASTVLPPRLASQLGLAVAKVDELVAMSGIALSSAGIVTALQGGPVAPLEALATTLVPLAVLFRPKVYDAAALAFVRTNAAIFGATDLTAVDLAAIRALSGYTRFAARLIADQAAQQATVADAEPDLSDLHHVLSTFDPTTHFTATNQGRLATVLRTEQAMVATLLPHLALPATAIDALSIVDRAAVLAISLGVGGDALALIVSGDYDDLNRAAEAVLSAIRAKYPDEEEFANRLDPFADRVRTGRRDALTDYLIRSVHPEFAELDELYQHFLLDVQLEGCARTSRLVAAISSVQLYVHRILMNLEQDRRQPSDPLHVAVPVGAIPADEWQWRKNYRVWEANRKVFLWPENYIEPELRDDKTPLFKELESTLLQQDVNEQNVLDAYASYLAGFEEVAGLQIAGAYHDKDTFRRTDVLHLFGVTPGDPPVFYYRTIDNAIYGETEPDRGTVYRPWQKIEVQIPVRRVAPVVHLGRLFVFWTELVTTPKNEVKDAGSQFVGYRHRLTLKYTTLRLDGRWSPPQAVSLSGTAFPTGEGVVEDPLAEQSERDAFTQAVVSFDFQAAYNAMTAMATPRFDTKVHPEPLDGYTLKGFQWDRVYPQRSGTSDLTLTGRNFRMRAGVDFYRKAISTKSALNVHTSSQRLLAARPEGLIFRLYSGRPTLYLFDDYPQSMIVADSRRIDALGATAENKGVAGLLRLGLYASPLAHLFASPEITVVNGSRSDAVVDLDGDLFYVRGSAPASGPYTVRRLGTTLGETMSRLLFAGGVDALLDTPTQRAMQERFPRFWPGAGMRNDIVPRLDFRGSFGTYFREVYFHIPFLIANHLNGQQRFAAAQQWYHYIFNPM
ncbi:MAG: neuraminidase-like domain-containing protein, partial [Micromonosporaceae bacterium]